MTFGERLGQFREPPASVFYSGCRGFVLGCRFATGLNELRAVVPGRCGGAAHFVDFHGSIRTGDGLPCR